MRHPIGPAEFPALTSEELSSLSDRQLVRLLVDLHRRADRLSSIRAAALEPAIAALEAEAASRRLALPGVPETILRVHAIRCMEQAAAAGDLARFHRMAGSLDAAGLFRAYLLALQWPTETDRSSAVAGIAWCLRERLEHDDAEGMYARYVARRREASESELAKFREDVEGMLAELIAVGEWQRARWR